MSRWQEKKPLNRFLGLRGKTITVLTLLMMLSLGILGTVVYYQMWQFTKQKALRVVWDAVQDQSIQIQGLIGKIREDLLVVHRIPLVSAISRTIDAGGIDPRNGDSLSDWRGRFQQIGLAVLKNKPYYAQLRYLDEHGDELIRVERNRDSVYIVPDNQLQNKSNEPYFIQASKLGEEEIYYSDVTLNREHGRIEEPHTPMFRIATPVFDDKKRHRGIIILNIYARHILAKATNHNEGYVSAFVIDQNGNYLDHPDPVREYGRELGTGLTINELDQPLLDRLAASDHAVFDEPEHGHVEAFNKIFFNPDDHDRYWALIHEFPTAIALHDLYEMRRILVFTTLLITLPAIFVIVWGVNHRIVTPVRLLARASQTMAKGDLSIRLPAEKMHDEFIDIFGMLNAFADKSKQTAEYLEQQVAERTKKLTAIVDNLVDGLIIIDETGTIKSFNPSAERIFGYSQAEVTGKNVKILMPAPYRSEHDFYIHNYKETGIASLIGKGCELEGLRKDGTIFSLELSISEVHTSGKRIFVGSVRDISERKTFQLQIEQKNEQLERRGYQERSYGRILAIFSSAREPRQIFDSLLNNLAENHAFLSSAIYLVDESRGCLVCAAAHGAPAALQQEVQFGEGVIGECARQSRLTIINKFNGDFTIDTGLQVILPTSLVVSPINYQDKLTGVLVLARIKTLSDETGHFITRLSSQLGIALNNLKQYNDLKKLSAELEQRHAEIASKNKELQTSNRMKTEFLANMSHELRTPLNAIIGFSEILKAGVVGDLDDSQHSYVQDIFDSGQHLLALINDILDLSKVEAGKMELDLGYHAIADILNNSIAIIREKAAARDLKVKVNIADTIDEVLIDARKFKQCIYNVLSNAVKFTPPAGSITLTAKRANRAEMPITPAAASYDEFLEVTIADSGIGIAEDDLEKLFRPFEQIDGSLARQYEGTGLGLAMVKKLVELHGGLVHVESKPGKGSCFYLWFPYRPGKTREVEIIPQAQTITLSAEQAAPHQNKTTPLVLIVEDDDQAADLLRIQLDEEGLRTVRAASAEEASQWLADHTPDLITLDIMLPGMDGWHFLEAVKKDERLAGIPVIVASIVADEHKSLRFGATQILQKPVTQEELRAAVAGCRLDKTSQRPSILLVMDDNPKVESYLTELLENAFCKVMAAHSGQQAIDYTREARPDLIVLDLVMPDMTGFEVIDRLKSDPSMAKISVIVLAPEKISDEENKLLKDSAIRVAQKHCLEEFDFLAEVKRSIRGMKSPADISLGGDSGKINAERDRADLATIDAT